MDRIYELKNIVQEYAWGSKTAIPELMGHPSPADKPQAELWMGAHPKAPSMVMTDDTGMALDRIISDAPGAVLGRSIASRFQNRLPFLFKVLAAGNPLSIQAHPDKAQAEAGYIRENEAGIALDAFERSYKDDNHKPEMICALTDFYALNGFRPLEETIELLDTIGLTSISDPVGFIKANPTGEGLKKFYSMLMHLDDDVHASCASEAANKAKYLANKHEAYEWVSILASYYQGDIGIISPLLLNLYHLKPGEALYLTAGVLHSYLRGTGIEIMANSDNVLRGGLTPKFIDRDELLKILKFSPGRDAVLNPEDVSPAEKQYPKCCKEFDLSVIQTAVGQNYTSQAKRNIEILLCTDGSGEISSVGLVLPVKKGNSYLVPAAAPVYTLSGEMTLFKATVP